MDAVERRAEKRVRPPGDALLDFALWPAEPAPPPRLLLPVLGLPATCRLAGDTLVLIDITAIGLGLRLDAGAAPRERIAAAPAVFVYLKLREYRPKAQGGVLSLFFHARSVRVEPLPDGLALGLRFTRQGRGSSFEKSLELLDVSHFGVPMLAAWIDALVRDMEEPQQAQGPGLDLDRLLDEPQIGLTPTAGQRDKP